MQPCRHRSSRSIVFDSQEDQELVTANACKQITAANGASRRVRVYLQSIVASGVSERIVDLLQSIEVGIDHQPPMVQLRKGRAEFEEGLTIQCTGEWIRARQPPFPKVGSARSGNHRYDYRNSDKPQGKVGRERLPAGL